MADIVATGLDVAGRVGRSWTGQFGSVAARLAWRNFARDRVRLGVAVVGVGFAVVLMAVQLGLLIGFATTASSLVDHARADFWIVPTDTQDVDQAGQMPDRWKYRIAGFSDVDSVTSLLVRFAYWSRPGGGSETVIVVGIDPSDPALVPWNFVAGSPESLRFPDGIAIDRLYAKKLGVTRLGEVVEIGGHRARVVAFTSGVRTFTQSPYVFASLDTARRLTDMSADWTSYLLVRAREGSSLGALGRALQGALPSAEVESARRFSWQTRAYWLLTTGAGAALLIAAALGLLVGVVIVSQTLYAATVERLDEYATIRAMGATNRYLKSIILCQAAVSAAFGYGAGMVVAVLIAVLARNGSAALILPWPLALALAVVTLTMCIAASLISMRKVLTADPASVFK
jgi:putative ABC transport system permease protein